MNNSVDYDKTKSPFTRSSKQSISDPADHFGNTAPIKFMNLTAHLDSDKQKYGKIRFEDKSFNERKATRDEILKRFKSNVQSLTGLGDYSTADGSFMSKTLNKSFQNNPRLTTVLRSTFESPNRINYNEATSNQRPKDERLWGLV